MKRLERILSLGLLLFTPLFVLDAQSVDLIWQGNTYTPPFYEGRSLWSFQSDITFVAIPHGLGGASSLNYKWISDGTVLGSVSGIGRNTLTFPDTIFSRPQEVRVQIMAADNTVLAERATVVTPTSPEILVYENSPLYGYSFHKEIGGGFTLPEGEVSLSAFPLYASSQDRYAETYEYRWKTPDDAAAFGPFVTYRVPEEGSGVSRVNLVFKDLGKIIEPISKDFLIQFGYE